MTILIVTKIYQTNASIYIKKDDFGRAERLSKVKSQSRHQLIIFPYVKT